MSSESITEAEEPKIGYYAATDEPYLQQALKEIKPSGVKILKTERTFPEFKNGKKVADIPQVMLRLTGRTDLSLFWQKFESLKQAQLKP